MYVCEQENAFGNVRGTGSGRGRGWGVGWINCFYFSFSYFLSPLISPWTPCLCACSGRRSAKVRVTIRFEKSIASEGLHRFCSGWTRNIVICPAVCNRSRHVERLLRTPRPQVLWSCTSPNVSYCCWYLFQCSALKCLYIHHTLL